MTQIIRASHLGFCFGVRDALEAAEGVSRPDETTVYGQLVHNTDVTDSLRQRHFHLLDETDRDVVPQRPLVMVTAHGISDRRRTLTNNRSAVLSANRPGKLFLSSASA